jgi:dihydroorotase
MSETALLAAAIECIAELNIPVHFMRVSTARGVELIDRAKQRGLNITASTPWTHLLLSTRNLGSYDPNLHLSPPLGTPADRDALAAAVVSGTIDAIAVDHTPIAYEDKTVAFSESPAGAIGLELALPLLWQEFVESAQWSPLTLWRSLSLRPAQCLQLDPPRLHVDAPAELVLFDPNRPWTPNSHSLQSKSSNTPWLDRQISGRVLQTYHP